MKVRDLARHALGLVLWAFSSALVLLIVLAVRGSCLAILAAQGVDSLKIGFVEKLVVVAAGLAALCGIIGIDYYYRRGIERGVLPSRAARIVGSELLVLFALNLSVDVAAGVPPTPRLAAAALLVEGVGGAALLVASIVAGARRRSARR